MVLHLLSYRCMNPCYLRNAVLMELDAQAHPEEEDSVRRLETDTEDYHQTKINKVGLWQGRFVFINISQPTKKLYLFITLQTLQAACSHLTGTWNLRSNLWLRKPRNLLFFSFFEGPGQADADRWGCFQFGRQFGVVSKWCIFPKTKQLSEENSNFNSPVGALFWDNSHGFNCEHYISQSLRDNGLLFCPDSNFGLFLQFWSH